MCIRDRYGVDNSAILKGIKAMNDETPGRAKGVCAITMDVTDKFLEELNDQGITGVRLNMDNIGGMPIGLDQIPELETRIKGLGWHMEYLFPGKDIIDLAKSIISLPGNKYSICQPRPLILVSSSGI